MIEPCRDFDIIRDCLMEADEPLTIAEVSDATGVSRNCVRRYIHYLRAYEGLRHVRVRRPWGDGTLRRCPAYGFAEAAV
jgi:response regulator of citrate/malate metabolism